LAISWIAGRPLLDGRQADQPLIAGAPETLPKLDDELVFVTERPTKMATAAPTTAARTK